MVDKKGIYNVIRTGFPGFMELKKGWSNTHFYPVRFEVGGIKYSAIFNYPMDKIDRLKLLWTLHERFTETNRKIED